MDVPTPSAKGDFATVVMLSSQLHDIIIARQEEKIHHPVSDFLQDDVA
ncbi:MAG: hypothetical protein HDQ98_15195 [Lachnospiraceae bacterium]|nr:hypothetical protein [Lachnospiraceae bacterium]